VSEREKTVSELLKILPGAVEAGWPDEGVAAHYGDPAREQRALDGAGGPGDAGFVDRSNRGVLKITGPDRLSWLHSLTTQHLTGLAAGASAQALVLSPTGHLEHHLSLSDDGTSAWVHVEPGTAPSLAAFLESMRFMLRVEVRDWDRRAAVAYAGLRASCERRGVSLAPLDMMIAAHAIAEDAVLVTRDKAFTQVEERLRVEDWASA